MLNIERERRVALYLAGVVPGCGGESDARRRSPTPDQFQRTIKLRAAGVCWKAIEREVRFPCHIRNVQRLMGLYREQIPNTSTSS